MESPAGCMESPQAYVITRRRVILLRIDAIHHCVMIPFAPSSRFHAATSCGFHTRLRRDWDAEDAHQTHGQIRTATPQGRIFRQSRNSERPRATAGRPYQIKIHLQSHRCNGILDRFRPMRYLKNSQTHGIMNMQFNSILTLNLIQI